MANAAMAAKPLSSQPFGRRKGHAQTKR